MIIEAECPEREGVFSMYAICFPDADIVAASAYNNVLILVRCRNPS